MKLYSGKKAFLNLMVHWSTDGIKTNACLVLFWNWSLALWPRTKCATRWVIQRHWAATWESAAAKTALYHLHIQGFVWAKKPCKHTQNQPKTKPIQKSPKQYKQVIFCLEACKSIYSWLYRKELCGIHATSDLPAQTRHFHFILKGFSTKQLGFCEGFWFWLWMECFVVNLAWMLWTGITQMFK